MADDAKPPEPREARPPLLSRVLAPVRAITGPWTSANGVSWLKLIVFILVLRWAFLELYTIPSGSMEPTLHGDPRFFQGDRVAVNKFVFGPRVPFTTTRIFSLAEPRRWDIVVFNAVDPDARHQILIKRVVGLPGERVHISGGKVYADGVALEPPEPLREILHYTTGLQLPDAEAMRFMNDRFRYGILEDEEFSVIPDGHYLMLGDNSENSLDGRVFGWVPHENLYGRAFAVALPFSRTTDLTGFSKTWWGMLLLYGLPIGIVVFELVRGFAFLPWRLDGTDHDGGLREGDHVIVNRIAFGLRIPFTRRRFTQRRSPKPGELVAYVLEQDTGRTSGVRVGRVLEGDAAEPAGDDVLVARDAGETPQYDRIERAAIIGTVVAVYWPLRRSRRVLTG